MTTPQHIRQLLEEYEHEYKAIAGPEWFDRPVPGAGYTDEARREAETKLGLPIPDHIIELWKWKSDRTAPFMMSVYMPLPHCVLSPPLIIMEDGTRIPFKGLQIGEVGQAGFAISVDPSTEGEIWILGVSRSYGDGNPFDWPSGWTSLEHYITDQIHWLRNGPIIAENGQARFGGDENALDELGIHPNVRHAMCLNGPPYWY